MGAAYEMAQAAGLGIDIKLEDIPLEGLTRRLCSHLNINPYRLISSGSMLIAASDAQRVMDALAREGIPSAVIGEFTLGGEMRVIKNGRAEELTPPERDELYKLKEL